MTAAAVVLPGLGGIIAVLLAVALSASVLPGRSMPAAMAGLCGLALAGAVLMLAGESRGTLGVSIGLGLLPGVLAADPMAAWFVLAIALAGLASCGRQGISGRSPALIATALLIVSAGDGGTAILGIAGFVGLSGGRLTGAIGVILLAGALALAGVEFAAIRQTPPEGWRAALVLALLLGGLLAAGWRAGPMPVLTQILGAYLVCRIALDLCGPATPPWWGTPLVLAGAALACAGAVYGLCATSLPAVLSGLMAVQGGWVIAGTGILAVARAADLLPVATLAGGAVMLHVLTLAVAGGLAAVVLEAAARGAGSQMLDRLGGLAARMPVVAWGMLVAGSSLVLLPPGAGFASAWMLLQAGFAATRLGGPALHLVLAFGTMGLAASAGLGVAAIVRLGGMAFLGRPRTPRAAAAEEASLPERVAILGLSGLSLVLGLVPGLAVSLAQPAQQWLTRARLEGQAGWAGVQTQQAAPGYAPLALTLVLGAIAAALILGRRRFLPGQRTIAAWQDGFAAPPPWMPFGDPAAQATAASLGLALPRPGPSWPRLRITAEWPMLPPVNAATALLGLAVALMVAVLLLGPP